MAALDEPKLWIAIYPDWMPAVLPTPEESILGEFDHSWHRSPESPCVYYFDQAFTYQDIHKMANALAGALEKIGVHRGDRVLLNMQNIPQAVLASLAIWRRNGIVVPVNPMYTARELNYYIEDADTRVVICQDDLYEGRVKEAVAGRENTTVITTSPLDLLGGQEVPAQLKKARKLSLPGTRDLMDLVREHMGLRVSSEKPSPEDLAYLAYTSGTTGPAKGAMISHANVVYNSYVYEKACRLDRHDVVLGVAPLFHITGVVAHLAIAFHLGIPLVLFHRFDAGDVLRLIEKYRVTFTVAAITVYIALLNYPNLKKFNLTHFQKAYSGGAPVSPATVNKFREALGLTIHNVYGLTESTSPATITPLGLEGPVDADSGALSVGLIVPGHEAWIVDIQDPGREVPLGEEGELVLRGPGITCGYWNKPDETSNAIQNGRFFTGDVAKFDARGWCYIVDRKKDLINASGYKIWPREVEDMLYRHPGVKEAAVVGIPDPYRGETVKAFVSLRDEYQGKTTPEELIAFCKGQMAAYKYPRIVEIIEEIPKTATGKVMRRTLRQT
jgi:long-chain acyl-CoA synthetase